MNEKMKNEYLKLIGKKVLKLNEENPNDMEFGRAVRNFLLDKFSSKELYPKDEQDENRNN